MNTQLVSEFPSDQIFFCISQKFSSKMSCHEISPSLLKHHTALTTINICLMEPLTRFGKYDGNTCLWSNRFPRVQIRISKQKKQTANVLLSELKLLLSASGLFQSKCEFVYNIDWPGKKSIEAGRSFEWINLLTHLCLVSHIYVTGNNCFYVPYIIVARQHQSNTRTNVDNSILVLVLALCRRATSHYLDQRWPRSAPNMASLGHNDILTSLVRHNFIVRTRRGMCFWSRVYQAFWLGCNRVVTLWHRELSYYKSNPYERISLEFEAIHSNLFSLKEMRLRKMLLVKWRPLCSSLNALDYIFAQYSLVNHVEFSCECCLFNEAEINWPLLSRWHFQIYFLVCQLLYFDTISLKFVPKDKCTMSQHWFERWFARNRCQTNIEIIDCLSISHRRLQAPMGLWRVLM